MAEVSIDLAVELGPIVGHNLSRDAEPTYNIFLDKLSNIPIFDRREGFGLNPFTEIVSGHQQ